MTIDELTADAWEARVAHADGLIVVDIGAEWCMPCKRLDPMLTEIAAAYESEPIRWYRLDADDAPDIIAEYQVLSLPTVLIIRGGQEIDRVTGVPRRRALEKRIHGHLPPS